MAKALAGISFLILVITTVLSTNLVVQRSDPANSGRYTIMDDKLYITMGRDPAIVPAAPKNNTVTIESVTYTRQ